MIDEKTKNAAQTAIIRARIKLLRDKPGYAHLAMKLELCWMEQLAGGLSATDGKRLMVMPGAFLALSQPEQASCLVHEVVHVAMGHPWRCGERDHFRWNIAGDVYIANLLEAEGMQQIQGAEDFLKSIQVDRAVYTGMSCAEIYDALPSGVQGSAGQSGAGQSSKGEGKGQARSGDQASNGEPSPANWNSDGGCFHPATSPEEGKALDRTWQRNVVEAGQLARNQSGAWDELVKAAMPKPPFSLKLFEYLERGMGGDTSFDAISRRHIHAGMYLPSSVREVMGDVVSVIDTSGSMSSAAIAEGLGYQRAFRDEHPHRLHLIQCDYDVPEEHGYQVFEQHDEMPSDIVVAGRGGTSFDAPFRLIKERGIRPTVVIYYTDGYGSVESESDPGCPVLWVIVKGAKEDFRAPFGEVCHASA